MSLDCTSPTGVSFLLRILNSFVFRGFSIACIIFLCMERWVYDLVDPTKSRLVRYKLYRCHFFGKNHHRAWKVGYFLKFLLFLRWCKRYPSEEILWRNTSVYRKGSIRYVFWTVAPDQNRDHGLGEVVLHIHWICDRMNKAKYRLVSILTDRMRIFL